MDTINKLIRQRDMTLSLVALSFVVWLGGRLAEDMIVENGWSDGAPNQLIELSVWGGGIGGVLAAIMFLAYAARLSKAKAQSVLKDELFAQIEGKALRFGYWAMLVSTTALLAADKFTTFSAETAIRVLLIVGIGVPLVSFVILSTFGGASSDGDEE